MGQTGLRACVLRLPPKRVGFPTAGATVCASGRGPGETFPLAGVGATGEEDSRHRRTHGDAEGAGDGLLSLSGSVGAVYLRGRSWRPSRRDPVPYLRFAVAGGGVAVLRRGRSWRPSRLDPRSRPTPASVQPEGWLPPQWFYGRAAPHPSAPVVLNARPALRGPTPTPRDRPLTADRLPGLARDVRRPKLCARPRLRRPPDAVPIRRRRAHSLPGLPRIPLDGAGYRPRDRYGARQRRAGRLGALVGHPVWLINVSVANVDLTHAGAARGRTAALGPRDPSLWLWTGPLARRCDWSSPPVRRTTDSTPYI